MKKFITETFKSNILFFVFILCIFTYPIHILIDTKKTKTETETNTKFKKSDTIEVGQTWTYILYEKDPFKTNIIKTYKVIDIKNNYIQTIDESGDTTSTRKDYFLMNTLITK